NATSGPKTNPTSRSRRLISEPQALRLQANFVTLPYNLAHHGNFALQGNVDHDEPRRLRIDSNRAGSIAEPEPATGDRTLFDQDPLTVHLCRGIASANRQNGPRFLLRSLPKHCALRPVATGEKDQTNS